MEPVLGQVVNVALGSGFDGAVEVYAPAVVTVATEDFVDVVVLLAEGAHLTEIGQREGWDHGTVAARLHAVPRGDALGMWRWPPHPAGM